jgi:hypothetical protein
VYKDPKVIEHDSNTIGTHLPMTYLYQEKKQEIKEMRRKEEEGSVLVLYAAKIITKRSQSNPASKHSPTSAAASLVMSIVMGCRSSLLFSQTF